MRFQFATVEFHSIVVPQRVEAKQELSQREGSFLCSLSTRLFTSKSSVFARGRGSNPTIETCMLNVRSSFYNEQVAQEEIDDDNSGSSLSSVPGIYSPRLRDFRRDRCRT